MKLWLCPSLMCANFGNLEKEIDSLDACGVDYLHLDVMDGAFVKNFGMGMQDIDYVCQKTKSKTEVNLMIENPQIHIERFAKAGINRVIIHPESGYHPERALQTIKNYNMEAGIAISPGISFQTIVELLPLCDVVMVMMVNPGFAGQGYLSYVENKIFQLVDAKKKHHYELLLDGACSEEIIDKFSRIGVKGYVLGTSALFRISEGSSYHSIISRIRKLEI